MGTFSMFDSFNFRWFYTNFRMFIVDCILNNVILALNEYNIMYFTVNMFIKGTCLCTLKTFHPTFSGNHNNIIMMAIDY